jgi:GST-like protein
MVGMYGAREVSEFDKLKNVPKWYDRMIARPAVERGVGIPKRPG